MKKIFLTMWLCCVGAAVAMAQTTKVIRGAVIDKNGNPLPGAIVEATGGAENVTADADGTFSMEVPFWLKTLTARYAGMKDKKLKLKGDNLLFRMKPDNGGKWFVNFIGSYVSDSGHAGGRVGLMGGYMGNWGGYAKVMPTIGLASDGVPSVTLGVIKRLYKPLHLYWGLGFVPVEQIYSYSYSYYSSSSYYDEYWDPGMAVDLGLLFKVAKHFNINVGYTFNTEFESYAHEAHLGFGYAF